jgi:hypothetical protein
MQGRIFGFELDFAGDLRCIPMAVRYNLDLAGIKLSLRQWSRMSAVERDGLLAVSAADASALDDFRKVVTACLLQQGDQPAHLGVEQSPPWSVADVLPDQVSAFAALAGVASPTLPQWQALTELQRFTLLKLSRAKHDNVNFVPALREFGLLPT